MLPRLGSQGAVIVQPCMEPSRAGPLYSGMKFIAVDSSSSLLHNPYKIFIVFNSHFSKLIISFLFINSLPGLSGFPGTYARHTGLHA